jgi:hypothetical protein
LEPLTALLSEMLAFEEEDRPFAMDVYKRMKSLARQITGGELEDWAEEVLPAIVEQFQTQTAGEDEPLCGQTLTADVASPDLTESVTLWVHQTQNTQPDTPHSEDTDPGAFVIPPRYEPAAAVIGPAPPRLSAWPPVLLFSAGSLVMVSGMVALALALWMSP